MRQYSVELSIQAEAAVGGLILYLRQCPPMAQLPGWPRLPPQATPLINPSFPLRPPLHHGGAPVPGPGGRASAKSVTRKGREFLAHLERWRKYKIDSPASPWHPQCRK